MVIACLTSTYLVCREQKQIVVQCLRQLQIDTCIQPSLHTQRALDVLIICTYDNMATPRSASREKPLSMVCVLYRRLRSCLHDSKLVTCRGHLQVCQARETIEDPLRQGGEAVVTQVPVFSPEGTRRAEQRRHFSCVRLAK